MARSTCWPRSSAARSIRLRSERVISARRGACVAMFASRFLDVCSSDSLDGQFGERREVAEAVLSDSDRLRPRTDAAGGADYESLEPGLTDLAEGLRRRLIEATRLAPPVDVEFEGLCVFADGERARALAAVDVAVSNVVAALSRLSAIWADPSHGCLLRVTVV